MTNGQKKEPLTTRDPEKFAIAIAQLDNLLGATNSKLSLKGAILAERLERPERELRAEMKAAGLTYRALLDSVRQEIFLEQYHKGESFASIAQNLAYNDQAAFTRAFRRWYGVPPGQWKPE